MLHGACVFGFGLVLVFGSSVAWAGRGWYFLIPPVYGERDALEVVRTAPLRQWEQGGAFDSAGEQSGSSHGRRLGARGVGFRWGDPATQSEPATHIVGE